ncbi:MAG: hypothetical protein GYA17_08055 [Chloroflexi bacterium]|nr:hypothetical protein [Anaerolineaceae bacterium]NMB88300.1 hypothetical protein [Chloroflexota bacterium]
MQSVDLIWTLVGFILTLLVFSYLFGDNPLFRLATYLFVGVTAGYAFVLVVYQVLLPRLFWPLLSGELTERLLLLVPLVLSTLLVFKISPRFTNLGSIPMAYLVGVGAAVAIGGAVVGTLVAQSRATIDAFGFQASGIVVQSPALQFFEGIVLLVGVVSTLVYFHFGASSQPDQPPQRAPWIEIIARIGQVFIAITLGALFAGVYAAAITALIDRLSFIVNVILSFF